MNPIDLKLSSYHYDLPGELIAQRPADISRLLVYKASTNEIFHDVFPNIGNYLPQETLLVFNRSKVFPSRLLGSKPSGGKVELFLLSTTANDNIFPALIKTRSKKHIGDTLLFPDGLEAKIVQINNDGTFGVTFNQEDLLTYMNKFALIPIPPYIRGGESDELDRVNYQTSYANELGSVAAPTAGLHFKPELLSKLKNQNIDSAFVTLHVGLGTFKPVTVSDLREHQMHVENYFVDQDNLELIKFARASKKKIFAVGTTTLRVLESSFHQELKAQQMYQTNIFLHPGKSIESIDGLITNFHLPESTLLMLVSTLIGREKTLELYQIAIAEKYRFFSYGDGMLIIR